MNRGAPMSIRHRYDVDPMVRALVDSLEQQISTLNLTPTEIRECAMLAAIHFEARNPRAIMIQRNQCDPEILARIMRGEK